MKYKTRKTWRNDAGNQRGEPLRQYWPTSLDDLLHIIETARTDGVQVRAAASSHSWSDVCLTTGYLVRTEKLNKFLPLEQQCLRADADLATLCCIESGVRLRELNKVLWERGLGLINMGGYDAQTLVGAAATATHGSGIAFGPLTDFILSIDLVSDDGTVYRIERSKGITDPVAFQQAYPARQLVQDDNWFNAVAVGIGCMGLIYAIIFYAIPRYYLKEVRTLTTWEEAKVALRKGDVFKENRHYELLINPYKVKGEYRCLITTRNPTDTLRGLALDKLKRRFFTELLSSLPHIDRLLNLIFDVLPRFAPRMINAAMKGIVDDGFSGRSYKVFNIGIVNEIPALSAEIAFPMENERYIQGIERILEIAANHAAQGRIFHTSPMALRFVKGTDLFFAPQYDNDTCMLEIIMVKGTQGVLEMMYEYELASYGYAGRPHWGQINYLTGSHGLIRSMYPKYDAWMTIYRKLNQHGTFDSPFSKRVGFETHPFTFS